MKKERKSKKKLKEKKYKKNKTKSQRIQTHTGVQQTTLLIKKKTIKKYKQNAHTHTDAYNIT